LRILINGEGKQCEEGISLSALIDLLELPPQRIAVELNREVVRRADWKSTVLKNEDRLEIVHFVGGGSGFSSNRK
jgi:thiamine biosynthesis protein ThiS